MGSGVLVDGQAAAIVARLCELSRQGAVGLGEAIEWPGAVAEDGWYLSPSLLSLAGTDTLAALGDAQVRRLSFFEAINFFSLNIAGERYLLAGLADRLHRGGTEGYSSYLHYFLDEENKHLLYFAEFCNRFGGRIYPHYSVAFPRDYAPGEEDFVFFAKVLVFEEIVDHYNVQIARDKEIVPLAREINRLHHLDEVRHLAFGRLLVKDLFAKYAPRWSDETTAGVRRHVTDYLESVWRQYYNPAVYADAGLEDPYGLAERAYQSAAAVEHRRTLGSRLAYLREAGILVEEPIP